jgi:ArsR family transcriptional regulator
MVKHIQKSEYVSAGDAEMSNPSQSSYRSHAQRLKLLAHPTRLRLLAVLQGGEECVCHLTALLGERQAFVSQQLMFMRQAGLLADRKEGSRVYYRINDSGLYPILAALDMGGRDLESAPAHETVNSCPCPRCLEQGQRTRKSKSVARKRK